ncbi:DNA-processing protein DprA [Desulfomarina sp.]
MAPVLDWISLSLVPGLGVSGLWKLIGHFKGPGNVLRASLKELRQVSGIRSSQIENLVRRDENLQRGWDELRRMERVGVQALTWDDPLYPELLREIPDAPSVLYLSGKKELLKKKCIAIVGSRAATAYGRKVAHSLAKALVSHSKTVVSGLALGIDACAHRGALDGGGNTVAVLGCGLDVVYPRQNEVLYRKILEDGVVVSEYPLGTRPEGFRFPARNRIIAGLSRGIVVVEAARKSGSLITAQLALDYDREVFAVPGQIDSHKSAGSHWLLQQGAKLIQGVEDILDEFPGEDIINVSETLDSDKEINSLEPDSLQVLNALEPYPRTRDQVIDSVELPASRVNELLLLLELEGLVEVLPGDNIRRLR